MTAGEAAEVLGVTVQTVHRFATSGVLPTAMKLPGLRGARMFLRDDVERLAEERAA